MTTTTMTTTERWADVEGFEGYIRVSTLGRVAKMMTTDPIRFLSTESDTAVKNKGPEIFYEPMLRTRMPDGSQKVNIRYNGEGGTYYVHVMVAEAFLPRDPDKMDILHLDGNRSNNNLSNLQYYNKSDATYERLRERRKRIKKEDAKERFLERKKKDLKEMEEMLNSIVSMRDEDDDDEM